MQKAVVQVGNEKAKSMMYTEDGLRFVNKTVHTVEAFEEIFNKKISLVDIGELKYQDMKMLTVNGLTVDPHAGRKLGNSVADITFLNDGDRDAFIETVSQIRGWNKQETQISPLQAIKWDVGGILITPICAYYAFQKALEIESGAHVMAEGFTKSARNSRRFDNILEMIGSTGVLIIAAIIFSYLAYSIYKKYNNPPIKTTYS